MDELYSQLEIAQDYFAGDRILPKDPALSYFWASLAATNKQVFLAQDDIDYGGFTNNVRAKAKEQATRAKSQLTAAQVSEVEQSVARWKALHRP
jgi:hypothetical protein